MPLRGEHLRWPPRPRKRSATTRVKLATDEQPTPRLPNERDESSDSQASGPRRVMRQAHDDIAAGLQDTDCRNSAAEIIAKKDASRHRK